jgi:outer membrane protein
MRALCLSVLFALVLTFLGASARAQQASRIEEYLGYPARQKPPGPLPSPQGFPDHIVNGKLVLSLEDGIRLALANNTNIRLDYSQVQFAQNALRRSHQSFDPSLFSSFSDQKATSPSFTQLQGATVLKTLSQNTLINYGQTFETGTNFQTTFNPSKISTNSSFNSFNPSIATSLTFSLRQPLLRNWGLNINRAPIVIAQRNLKQARSTFQSQVNDIVLNAVAQYWNVVQARENLAVQRKSLDEAQKSYDHDKKALGLGALPPLDIYRSESQVASRKVGVIQAEYGLKQAEDQFRLVIGADIDPAIRVLDLELTESPELGAEALTMDIATALQRALANRPEFEAQRQQLANDETGIRLAHNSLRPDLELSGLYSSNSLAGNQLTPPPPVNVSFGSSLSQLFHFTYPTYGATLSLTLPIRNHLAEANLGDALASQQHDQYLERQTRQNITLEVTNAVHLLEQSKLSVEAAKIALDLAEKNLHADERKYELGAQTIFFVLEAQTELAQAEQNLVQAQIGYQLAVAAVDHATGDLLEHHHVQIQDPSK